jgi:hypothetical protein
MQLRPAHTGNNVHAAHRRNLHHRRPGPARGSRDQHPVPGPDLSLADQGHDPVARAYPGGRAADLLDFASDLEARHIRRPPGWGRIVSARLLQVRSVQPGGPDTNHNLTRPGDRVGPLLQPESPLGADHYCSHV